MSKDILNKNPLSLFSISNFLNTENKNYPDFIQSYFMNSGQDRIYKFFPNEAKNTSPVVYSISELCESFDYSSFKEVVYASCIANFAQHNKLNDIIDLVKSKLWRFLTAYIMYGNIKRQVRKWLNHHLEDKNYGDIFCNRKVIISMQPWDIATMSMRGAKSCQHWDARQATCLIGSIIDPSVGIIYMSDSSYNTAYGSTMIYRAIFRIVYQDQIGLCIFIEPKYCHDEIRSPSTDLTIENIFRHTLHKKYGLPVFTSNDRKTTMLDKSVVFNSPLFSSIEKLKTKENLHTKYLSYSDSRIGYDYDCIRNSYFLDKCYKRIHNNEK